MSTFTYCQALKNYCDRLAILEYVVRCEYTIDLRPPSQAYLRGHIEFANGTELHWTEFIDTGDGTLDKVRYSYHVQDKNHSLIIRYDNAAHKPRLPFGGHKHTPTTEGKDRITEAAAPTLADMTEEVARFYGFDGLF
jgi:hypothetical protein